MLWACLYFSDLPLRAVFDEAEQALPCAVVDGPRQRPLVVLANAPARQHGVDAGRVLAASRALCSTLQARTRDPRGEQRLLLSLAAWAYRFSSQVSLCGPDALLIEVGASLRLFGGWPALERRLRRELAAIGHAPAIAVTPLPAAARVLVAQHDGFFTDQREPMLTAIGCTAIASSGLDSKTISLLYNVGARTLRDAFALPRPELARRIGPAAMALLDRLRGIDHEVLPLYQPPDRFEHRVELDDRVEAWPPLLFPLRRLCGELALFLAARDGGVQRCDLVLDHEDKPATHMAIELLTPQREARTLYELVRSRLERATLAAPVCGIALIATDLPEFRPRHQDLFEPQREQGLDWPELAERLRAHLGDDAVRRLAAAADHRPERAWRFASGNHTTSEALRFAKDLSAPTPSPPRGRRKGDAGINAPSLAPAGKDAAQVGVGAARDVAAIETLPRAECTAAIADAFRSAHASAIAEATSQYAVAPSSPPPSLSTDQARSAESGGSRSGFSPLPSPREPAPQAPVSVAHGAAMPLDIRPRPLWLLRRALPLRGAAPRILSGPERIESGWWDGGDTRRDYYVVLTREGQRAWAFLVPGTSDGWMLHGWFA